MLGLVRPVTSKVKAPADCELVFVKRSRLAVSVPRDHVPFAVSDAVEG